MEIVGENVVSVIFGLSSVVSCKLNSSKMSSELDGVGLSVFPKQKSVSNLLLTSASHPLDYCARSASEICRQQSIQKYTEV